MICIRLLFPDLTRKSGRSTSPFTAIVLRFLPDLQPLFVPEFIRYVPLFEKEHFVFQLCREVFVVHRMSIMEVSKVYL